MEVASPITFAPSGTKRQFAYSPSMMETSVCGNSAMEDCEMMQQRVTKRRRFVNDSMGVENHASSPYLKNHNVVFSPNKSGQALKRRATSPGAEQLNLVVEEQAAMIDSLQSDKKELQSSLELLKTENERTSKENFILRKAVQIQQDRQIQAETELTKAQKYRECAEEQIRKMEQMILSLRYHLQTTQSTVGNDFMGMPPPDVF